MAQTVVKLQIEQALEESFLPDSYGYRPGKSALDAVGRRPTTVLEDGLGAGVRHQSLSDVASYCTFSFFERVEEARSNFTYLNSLAFCPSAIDVNGLKLAALYTLQDGLPRDAE
ncbi:hypothetical protein J2R76_003875 [Bradyrhizobium sp. USDA 4532]|nr:hypothetical protein [Bradyrhizobium sp. USDA 4545]MCP1920284.1 hypothetical protein [Bradyrhizobium sp. USDA 4532]